MPKLPARVDPDREFDTTSLRANASGQTIHRDYAAHFFRWGFASRFSNRNAEILDVGCGPDTPFIRVLHNPRNVVPRRYVGVDMNNPPRNIPRTPWSDFYWKFNFIARHKELGRFDLVICFEVLEHMRKEDGLKFLRALRACLKPTGTLLLSTPVFNGKAAANHLHEWTIPELDEELRRAKFKIIARNGTFANVRELRRSCTREERAVMERLSGYYSDEVLACFLAPLYPDASRNNIWQLGGA